MNIKTPGSLFIEETVEKSFIEAGKAVQIVGNVFSSTIQVGIQDFATAKLKVVLVSFLPFIDELEQQILKCMTQRTVSFRWPRLFQQLLKDKYVYFQKVEQAFFQQLKECAVHSSEKWGERYNEVMHVRTELFNSLASNVTSYEQYSLVIRQVAADLQEDEYNKATLEIPYAVNSTCVCSGSIFVLRQGLYNCHVMACQTVVVDGVCRGGEIFAKRKVSIKEVGSSNRVKTVIKTSKQGFITIGTAHKGTEIFIGNEHYRFEETTLAVHAHIREGQLVIH